MRALHGGAPSLASATTDMSGWPSISSLRPWRTVTWSSASRMRRRVCVSHGRSPVRAIGAAAIRTQDGRALAGCRLDFERGADQRGPLLHAEQAEARASRRRSARIEADAIVFDDEQDLVAAAFEDDVDVRRPRVLGDVGQRLLRDAVQRRFRFRGQPIVEQARGVQLRRDADPLRPVLDIVRQRRPQPEIVERRRAQLPHQMVDVPVDLLRDGLERGDQRARAGPAVAANSFSASIRRPSAVSCSPN